VAIAPWLDTIARPSSQGWIVPDPDHPATPAGQFRRVLADYARADLDAQGRSLRLDALIADLRHGCQAVALEDTEYCVLPFDELGDLTRSVAPLQQFLPRSRAWLVRSRYSTALFRPACVNILYISRCRDA